MSATSHKGTLVILDAETYNLRERPSSTSRSVRTARLQLISQLDLATLSEDLSRISKLIQIARHAASAAGYESLTGQITSISKKIIHLFDTTGSAVHKFRLAAEAVLDQLSLNHDLLSNRLLHESVKHLGANDQLARQLSAASSSLSRLLGEAAEDTTRAFSAAHLKHGHCQRDKEMLEDRMTELRIRKAKAWEMHATNLAALSEAGVQYAAAERRVRSAERRASMFGAMQFLCRMDVYMVSRFGVTVLSPVRAWLESVATDVEVASMDRRLLLEGKVRQRNENRGALQDITECSKRIGEVKSEADGVRAVMESLHAVSQELKRLSVVVMSMSAFWKEVEAHMGHMSASKVVMLLRETEREEEEEEEGVEIDVTERKGWKPCSAVMRVLVEYYARWVALSDVCQDCLTEIATARSECMKGVEEGGGLSPDEAREEVGRMAALLQKEMEEINVELEAFREHLAEH